MKCTVCGGEHFEARKILWDELTNDWQLSDYEADYINRQQGEACTQCGANLRSIALADAIRCHLGTTETLLAFASSPAAGRFSILEINEAGNLTQALRRFPQHVFGEYPQVDIHAIPYADASFDLVVHSDTLEHVPNPVHALKECKRVLKPGGAQCFTVPIVVDRMTRNRIGMKKSFHGDYHTGTDDFMVQTEFGADAWTYVMNAGFSTLSMHAVDYPVSVALRALA